MTIPTQMSLHGFIVSPPELTFTDAGAARFYARIGVEHFRKEADDTFTRLDPSYHDMVLFNASAERAYARIKTGDQFVATGYIHEYEIERNGKTEAREEYVARRIGHDLARTKYTVDRSTSRQADQPTAQQPGVSEPARSVGR